MWGLNENCTPWLSDAESTADSSCSLTFRVVSRYLFTNRTSQELHLNDVLICRNENERCLIETSVNSVRISVKVKQADELEEILSRMFLRFFTQRAEAFKVLRRKPVEGYDISFLVGASSEISFACHIRSTALFLLMSPTRF